MAAGAVGVMVDDRMEDLTAQTETQAGTVMETGEPMTKPTDVVAASRSVTSRCPLSRPSEGTLAG